ncbi:hypothetical protein Ami103574_10895 [Aminipila butyrica]|uniref:Type ii secretion system (T2ss) protein f n=1 Tax=Aminipila butyrica TaxID=433296 RepID=A0A858C098_9FIRM|nr:hypothetical protein [Aminipila butyrica]QIB69796.1 hypothetical protein Ami103574_10895 [Aminipila butyrica]
MGVMIIVLSGLFISLGCVCVIRERQPPEKKLFNATASLGTGFHNEDKLFGNTHYKMTRGQYDKFRLIVFIGLALMGILTLQKWIVLTGVIMYVISYPRRFIGKFGTPYNLLYMHYIKKEQQLKDDELFTALSLLRNMMVQLRHTPKGADYIIEYIAGDAKLTRPAFLKVLNLMRLGRMKEAEESFIQDIGTPLSVDTARILVQLDALEPSTMEKNLLSIQREISEIGNTKKQMMDELYSDMLLIPIIITVMLVFLDFLVVAYIGDLVQLNYYFSVH